MPTGSDAGASKRTACAERSEGRHLDRACGAQLIAAVDAPRHGVVEPVPSTSSRRGRGQRIDLACSPVHVASSSIERTSPPSPQGAASRPVMGRVERPNPHAGVAVTARRLVDTRRPPGSRRIAIVDHDVTIVSGHPRGRRPPAQRPRRRCRIPRDLRPHVGSWRRDVSPQPAIHRMSDSGPTILPTPIPGGCTATVHQEHLVAA